MRGDIDFEEVRELAAFHRPKLIVCGHSSYPREIDYTKFQAIAEEFGALTMADISHYAALVAAGLMNNPIDTGFDVVTTTTHKSLRGPRGGLILCKEEHAKKIDSSVFPGLQGGPHMNQVAATATTLKLAATPAFKDYARAVMDNAKALASALSVRQVALITGGTENHLMVADTVKSFSLDGRSAEMALDAIHLTVNKQVIPDDPNPPLRPSGIRIGTFAPTARGMGEREMDRIAELIVRALQPKVDPQTLSLLGKETKDLNSAFPIPGF